MTYRDETQVPSLGPLFAPRSIAVIGASRRRGTVAGELFANLLKNGFQGAVYPVNPKSSTVQSVHAYARVEDIPADVDLAVLVVPSAHVRAAVQSCGAKGVKAVVVISAGFGETGPTGMRAQEELLQIVRDHGMRMVGPNCLGILNTDPTVQMDATFAPTWPPAGAVSLSSQSGAMGQTILDHATAMGIGIRQFVSVGNKADVSGNDLLEYWENDDGTQVILLYLESFGNPRRFVSLAKRISRHKPILAVKSGRTAGGQRAAASHTGNLAGTDAGVDALFRQAGVIRTDTVEELFDLAMLLANQPVPKSDRVAVLTNAGGPGIMATDALESRGLVLPVLAEETVAKLWEFLPAEASLRNPVDMIASATAGSYGRAVSLLLDDPNIDSLLVIFVPPLVTEAAAVAEAIRDGLSNAHCAASKTVLACFMGTHGISESLRTLQAGRVPSYHFPEAAALALSRAVTYGKRRSLPDGVEPNFPIDSERGRAIIAHAVQAEAARASGEASLDASVWLSPAATEELLRCYGVNVPQASVASSVEDAIAAADEIGYPVAIKLVSHTLTHKSDVGGVHLGLHDAAGVRGAWEQIVAALEARNQRDAMQGVLVQEMVTAGLEVIVGATYDPTFGHLLMFGAGGVQVELLGDISWGVAPLADRDAEQMIRLVQSASLLDGYRGSPPLDREALQTLLLCISQLVCDCPDILEMDINPVCVRTAGNGVVAVDARIRVQSPPAPQG